MPVVALYCCLTKSQCSVFHHDLFSGAYQTASKMWSYLNAIIFHLNCIYTGPSDNNSRIKASYIVW